MDEALAQVSAVIRSRPNDTGARALLFAVLCYQGDWERAADQLKVWARLEPSAVPGLVAYERLLSLELARHRVFAGEADPPVRGTPTAVEQVQLEVLKHWSKGDYAAASAQVVNRGVTLLNGTREETRFAGLEDFDTRFGCLLEAFLPEGYSLVPFSQLQSLEAEAPSSFLDAVWRPAALGFGDGVVPAYLPVRYPGTEQATDPLVRMGRKTVCAEPATDVFIGLGQHFWLTREPKSDFSVMDFRCLRFVAEVAAVSS